MSKQARLLIFTVCMAGLATAIYGGLVWKIDNPAKAAAYLLTALLALYKVPNIHMTNGSLPNQRLAPLLYSIYAKCLSSYQEMVYI